jgi:CRISPR/Cas system CSM-associated protein Csm3 (group 7 of RAMP superfamily)
MSDETTIKKMRFLARVTIEFTTAFIIGGGKNLFFDDTFVADANGLPAIPGSTLAGILRHAWKDAGYGNDDALFGNQDHGSPLEISWGCIHNKNNSPVEGILYDTKAAIQGDEVLSDALVLASRDHVRINDKGVAAKSGKFDERSVSSGHRFTFELHLTGDSKSHALWENLLALLNSGTLRIGGKTRRGYGAFKCFSLCHKELDLTIPDQFDTYLNHPVSLKAVCGLPESIDETRERTDILPPQHTVTATVSLKPEGFWMFGGGAGNKADMNPVLANRICWKDGKGKVVEQLTLIPGSSVKGALAHRTAYYYNLQDGRFIRKTYTPDQQKPGIGADNEALRDLFGYSKDNKTDQAGQRGRVIISDILLEGAAVQVFINHVSLDRFTGGARAGFLFSENPFYLGNGFTLKVDITEANKIDPKSLNAFEAALADLATGLLPLGSGANRGNGYFSGEVKWSDKREEAKEAANA